MVEHDRHVGKLLDKLDELGVTENTLVFYSTDNGPHYNTWPDAAATPFRGEKNTNWEGGWRVPAMVRWPGKVPAGSVTNEIMAHMDWLPTLLAASGDPDIKQKLLKGHQAGGKRFKVHLDGYNQLDMLMGNGPSARDELFYFSDDGDLIALRYRDWKAVFMEQRAQGQLLVWANPFTSATNAEDFSPSTRPLRAGRYHVEHVLGLDDRSGFRAVCGAGHRRKLPGEFRAIPAEREGGELHGRPGA